MKLVLEIHNRSGVFIGRDDYQIMVDTNGLTVIREEVTERKSQYSWSDTIGYAIVIKNSNSGEVFYRREFKKQIEYRSSGVEIETVTIQQAAQQCNKELESTIQKINDAMCHAKKRHTEFTEPIKLIQ